MTEQDKNKQYTKEFIVNDYITLRLENEVTIIYVAGEPFNQCVSLLFTIPSERIPVFKSINSIDEAAETLNYSLKHKDLIYNPISSQMNYWGHCSNLQVWAENNYNTRLLHRNLAFSLLRKLVDSGDLKAKKVFAEEIAKRIESGYPIVIEYLFIEDYFKYLPDDFLDNIEKAKNFLRSLLIEYLSWEVRDRYIPGNKYIWGPCKRMLEELEKKYPYELDSNHLREEFAYNLKVRLSIIKLIPKYFPDKAPDLLECIIKLNKTGSVAVTFEILDIINKYYKEKFDLFKEIVLKEIQNDYNLCNDDSKLAFDLLSLTNEKRPKEVSEDVRLCEETTLFVKNWRIVGLDLGWCGIEELPESIELASELKYLHLRGNYMKKLPKSLANLHKLETFHTPYLFQRKKKIPHQVLSIANGLITEKYVKKGLNRKEARIMALLEIIFERNLYKTEIDESGHVKSLIFSGDDEQCDWTRFPEYICDLKYLETLNFYGFGLTKIPKSIGKLTSLKFLYLENNNLATLPMSVESLQNLEHLSLSNNKIKDFNFLRHFPNLKQLYLSSCGLSKIPEEIWTLSSLEYLNLSYNKTIEFPKSLSQLEHLPKLKSLDLYSCDLIKIPEIIWTFGTLEKLNLSRNKINELPKEIGQLVNLEELRLDTNHYLTKIPNTIGALISLRRLFLGHNNIFEIPSSIGNLVNLESLNLEDNKIKEIPDSIENLKSLKSLDLFHNQINNLPESIIELKSLENLTLRSNNIKNFSASVYAFLSSLKRFNYKD